MIYYKFKKYLFLFFLAPVLFFVLHAAFVYAQETYFIGERIMTGPAPLFSLEVLNDGLGVTSLFIEREATTQTPALYKAYRRCDNLSWTMMKEIKTADCEGLVCPVDFSVSKGLDSCDYAVSAVDNSGNEGIKSQSQKPTLISDSGDTATQSLVDGTSSITTSGNILVVSKKHIMYLKTEDADGVEWSVAPKGGVFSVLGSAKFDTEKGVWAYEWDTTTLQDGEYVLKPKVISNKGLQYQDLSTNVVIKNSTTPAQVTSEQQKLIDEVKTNTPSTEETQKTLGSFVKEAQDYLASEEGQKAVKQLASMDEKTKKETIKLFEDETKKFLADFSGNDEMFQSFQNSLIVSGESSSNDIDVVAKEFGITLTPEERAGLEKEVKANIAKLKPIIQETRQIIQKRMETDTSKDSDGDGISDYDEVHIYHTNPKKADTDGDGVSDGREILAGTDPLIKSPTAIVKYENPKTDGYVQDTGFQVKSINLEMKKTGEIKNNTSKKDAFKITGIAPKNSFVTMYVFSTPIIVTLKTDQNGNWSYTLDKELKDGKHEIYVAMTDNKGKILAKSQPLPFVKEAAAVTVAQSVFANTENNTSANLFDRTYLYGIGFLIIAIIGGVLVMGAQKRRVPNEE